MEQSTDPWCARLCIALAGSGPPRLGDQGARQVHACLQAQNRSRSRNDLVGSASTTVSCRKALGRLPRPQQPFMRWTGTSQGNDMSSCEHDGRVHATAFVPWSADHRGTEDEASTSHRRFCVRCPAQPALLAVMCLQ